MGLGRCVVTHIICTIMQKKISCTVVFNVHMCLKSIELVFIIKESSDSQQIWDLVFQLVVERYPHISLW